jgi:hypothetical protein
MPEQKEPIPVYSVPAPQAAQVQRQSAPSTLRAEGDLAQVMVDQWGHKGEFLHGQIVKLSELNPEHYDAKHALRVGALRLLTEAEARSLPTTNALDYNGMPDEDHARAMRFHAGIVEEQPQTVTTEQGPPEPREFAKPTIEYTGPNQEAARPVRVVGSAEEARAAGAQQAQVVATSSGPAFATPEEAEEQRAAEAGEPANEQRVQRRGRGRE